MSSMLESRHEAEELPPGELYPKKVVICIPVYRSKPMQQTLDAVRGEAPLLEAAGWQHGMVSEIDCPYISAARATMLRKALDAKATAIVFIDSDVSWEPGAILKMLEADGDVVAGTYRFKMDKEKYMGEVLGLYPQVREDGGIKMESIPAGFLKVTRHAVNFLMKKYPELVYGEPCYPHLDLFNHGAHEGCWWGEDYAFSRRWRDAGGDIWLIPTLNITHHSAEKAYPGNYALYLRRRPGGDLSDKPVPPAERFAEAKQRLAAIKAAG